MTSLISLGAINKLTGEYVYPKIANKKDEYYCPECNKDLILCQGDVRVHHFRHKVAINPCHHYSSPTETQIHKDAKLLMKTLLDKKIPVSFVRNCCCCKNNEEFEIPETSETSEIRLEHRFEYHGPKVADVAYIENGEILCIFEICNTHKTSSENRPEPWFEIDAETLIRLANDNCLSQIQIPCIRCEKCEDCVEKEIIEDNKLLKLLNTKLCNSTTYNQKQKWKDLITLFPYKKCIDLYELLDLDNDYYINIIHPITKQKIHYHVKRHEIKIKMFISSNDVFMIIKKWANEEKKYNNIKLWSNVAPNEQSTFVANHKYFYVLQYLLFNSKTDLDYDEKKKIGLDSDSDFILWCNLYDYKLQELADWAVTFNWKLDNVINWINGNGMFNRCPKCNCIFSYLKGEMICYNKFCYLAIKDSKILL